MDDFTVYATNHVVGVGSAVAVIAVADVDENVFIDSFVLVWPVEGPALYEKMFSRVTPVGAMTAAQVDRDILTAYGRTWAERTLLDYVGKQATPDGPRPPPFTLGPSEPALLKHLWLFEPCRRAIKGIGRTTRTDKLRGFIAELRQLPQVQLDPPDA